MPPAISRATLRHHPSFNLKIRRSRYTPSATPRIPWHMRKRSLRRVYLLSFGLSLLSHLAVLGVSSLVRLQVRMWDSTRPVSEPRLPLQLLEAPTVLPPPAPAPAVQPEHPSAQSQLHAGGLPRRMPRQSIEGSPEPVSAPESDSGSGAASLSERLRGAWDPRLAIRPPGSTAAPPAAASMHERLVVDAQAAIQASNERAAAEKRDITYHLSRGFFPDGRRIMPTDGDIWQLSEILRQNEGLVRDSIRAARVRATRERIEGERRSRRSPE
jgi:hypothetical protein